MRENELSNGEHFDYERVREIEGRIRPMLAGHSPDVIGAVLVCLTATWVAGHRMKDGRDATLTLHEEIIKQHYDAVRMLAELEAFGQRHGLE